LFYEHQTTNTKQQTPNTKQQTPNTKQQTPNNKHQTLNNKHQTNKQTPNNKHQTLNNKHQTNKQNNNNKQQTTNKQQTIWLIIVTVHPLGNSTMRLIIQRERNMFSQRKMGEPILSRRKRRKGVSTNRKI
jgi:hypothetical protein